MTVESDRDLEGLRRVGRVVALARQEMQRAVEPGMTTAELDEVGARVLERHEARSAPKATYGFPGVNCISLNDEAVHGIPSPERTIRPGDLVKIDVTAELDGYVADSAVTVALSGGPEAHERLRACAEFALSRAVSVARAGRPISRIGRVLEATVRSRGFKVLKELHSHGVGRTIHEEPSIPPYFDRRCGTLLHRGLVITVEPIISTGTNWTVSGDDGFTILTADGSPSAHYEHTIVVTRGSPIVLTTA
jgi:methionyl aminopeptidase